MIHGRRDPLVRHKDAKAVYKRAKKVKLPAEMFSYNGGHGPWNQIYKDFTDISTSIYKLITKGAEAPAGCEEI